MEVSVSVFDVVVRGIAERVEDNICNAPALLRRKPNPHAADDHYQVLEHLTFRVASLHRRTFHHEGQGCQAKVIGVDAF
ncbi:hypothetical protein D9M70_578530 [compost metagenome]